MLGYIVNYMKSFLYTVEEPVIQMDPIYKSKMTESCIISPTLTPNVMSPLPHNKFSKN